MIPLLTSPWALAALAAIPALVAIYLFQRRFRTRDVSSLLLWDAIRQASMGGRTREPLRLPLAFWLELAAIILIALAAAGPLLPRFSRARPLVIVLDDSLSMSAGSPGDQAPGASSPRAQALGAIDSVVARGNHDPVYVVFAGATPQLAGGATLREKLRGWTCNAPSADLDAAIGFATQTGGPGALLLVVTDRPPDAQLEKGSLEWRAFGASRDNVAFAAAARSGGSRDRVLLEIASHSRRTETRALSLGARPPMTVTLAPGERKRLQFDAGGASAFEARINSAFEAQFTGDTAAYDDRVVLLAENRPPVRVSLRIANPDLRNDIETALRATGRAALTDVRPELVVSDGAAPPDGWSVVIHAAKAPSAVTGPYVVSRTHPVLRGVALDGLVWGVPAGDPAGDPLVLVGSRPLLTAERVRGGERLHLRIDPAISNLQRAPAWPALWWNILDWRSDQSPGLRAANLLLGGVARVRVDSPRATVVAPDGTRREIEASEGEIVVAATSAGVWSVDRHRFAVNALIAGESDLTRAASGTWGGWSDESLLAAGYDDFAWLALLLALAVLAWHHASLWSAAPARSAP